MKKLLISFGLIILIVGMVYRSVVHIRRIYSESPKEYYSEIDGCNINFDWKTDDKRILFLYRNIGKVCEK